MKVLLLSNRSDLLATPLTKAGDQFVASTTAPDTWPEADFVVSFGYRHIIREPYLSKYQGRMINIHISMLPWNRGADPNFWSWFDQTPVGVSIHDIDKGVDTGPVYAQAELTQWKDATTLRDSYNLLVLCAGELFSLVWPDLRAGKIRSYPQRDGGSFHKSIDKEMWLARLPQGWDSPVVDVMRLGGADAKIQ